MKCWIIVNFLFSLSLKIDYPAKWDKEEKWIFEQESFLRWDSITACNNNTHKNP